MNHSIGVRLVGLCAQCEIALVRRDPVAAPLLAQAARAADTGVAAESLALAARMIRRIDLASHDPADEAGRKVAQALNRVAAQEAQAAALGGADLGSPHRGPNGDDQALLSR